MNWGFNKLGYDLVPKWRLREAYKNIPDIDFYQPLFSPWKGYGKFKALFETVKDHTLVSPDRCWVLYILASQAICLKGDFCEFGVYKGGTAMLLDQTIGKEVALGLRKIHLFDTFEGMPETDLQRDVHVKGDFADISLEAVKEKFKDKLYVKFHKGLINETCKEIKNSKICFAHVDVDIYQSVIDCCIFTYPRLEQGGFIIFDDYGFPSCPGARQAVDEFFQDKPEKPLYLPTGQAVVFKM